MEKQETAPEQQPEKKNMLSGLMGKIRKPPAPDEKKDEKREEKREEKRVKKGGEKEEPKEPKKPRIHINPRKLATTLALMLGVSLALSVAAVFILDLTGWRSAVRGRMTDVLIGQEKLVVTQQLTAEFDERLAQALTEAVAQERTALDQREQALDAREEELSSREQEAVRKEQEAAQALAEVQEKQQEVDALEAQTQETLMSIDEMIAVYEAMDPENAAAIMEQFEDDEKLVLIFSNMKKETAAAILEVMEAGKAADILSRIGT